MGKDGSGANYQHERMKCLLLFLSIFCSVFGWSQSRIVKDNVNCTYGIKNSDGTWLVVPQYILIQEYETGYFLITDIAGVGIMDPTGKMILPCNYKSIEVLGKHWRFKQKNHYNRLGQKFEPFFFIALKDHFKEVFNSAGESISERRKYRKILVDDQSHLMLYEHNAEGRFSTYIDTSGNLIIPRINGFIERFHSNKYSTIADLTTPGGSRGYQNAGIISSGGELVIPRQYEYLKMASDTEFWFQNKEGTFGKMNMDGDTVIQPIYLLESKNKLNQIKGESWIIKDSTGLLGLMAKDGTILTKPAYEKIHINNGMGGVEQSWTAIKDEKTGILSSTGEISIPIIYDYLSPIRSQLEGNKFTYVFLAIKENKRGLLSYSGAELIPVIYDSMGSVTNGSSIPKTLLGVVVKKDTKYGIISSDGTIIQPCTMTHSYRQSQYSTEVYQYNAKNIKIFKFDRKIDIQTLTLFAQSSGYYLFRSKDRILVFTGSTNDDQIYTLDNNNGPYHTVQKLYIIKPAYPESMLFFNQNGNKLATGEVVSANDLGNFLVLTDKANKKKLMSKSTGRIFAEDQFDNFQDNYQLPNRIWASKADPESNLRWVIIDTTGKQAVKSEFESNFQLNQGETLITKGYKKGIINSNTLKWVIPAHYSCLWKITNELYYVANSLGKRGILNKNGNYLLTMEYDSIGMVYSSHSLNMEMEDRDRTIWWIVQKGDFQQLVSNRGKRITGISNIKSMLMYCAFGDGATILAPNYANTALKLHDNQSSYELQLINPNTKNPPPSLFANRKFRSAVFDTLTAITFRSESFCDYYSHNLTGSIGYTWNSSDISSADQTSAAILSQIGPSCNCNSQIMVNGSQIQNFSALFSDSLAMTISYYYTSRSVGWGMDTYSSTQPIYLNTILQNGKIKFVELMDIFKSDSILRDEFLIALQKRDDLDIDCSAPDKLTEIIQGKFSLSNEGVHVYLNGYSSVNNDPSQVFILNQKKTASLLIPIERLRQHKETKWLGDLLAR
ncbi:MAG: hypothetical protein ACI865_000394 [Flavobacteriaceae bacterium]|jgi:hypothetical protein